ncbi:MAG: hypothetical protein IJP48_11465 [Synergistaceae bacterium]|nr:hypothetical protein [Synergistaceae bacterium]
MRRLIVIIMFVLTLCESAFALNDREYYDMKKDPFFRASDKRLTKLIDELKNILPDEDYKALRESHKEWIASGLDRTAEDLIANNNLSKVDAYVQSIEGRIKYIERLKRRYTNEPEPEIAMTESKPEPETQTQTQTQHERRKLTQKEAQELLERELKKRGIWQRNNVLVIGSDSDSDSAGGETLTLYDEADNKEELCWHFIHGEDFPDYISAINDYYVGMNDGSIYVLDTFEDVVRPIDEAEL